jgi:predicted O-methyltransferase YrrM
MIRRLRFLTAKLGIQFLRLSGAYSGYWNYWRTTLFDYAEDRGIHILPVHYYSPIPDMSDGVGRRRSNSINGINLDLATGTARAVSLLRAFQEELSFFFADPRPYDPKNSAFHPLDAAILFAMIRESRPKHIIEIGSGMSTLVMQAALKNARDNSTELRCIEPFVPSYLKAKQDQITEVIEKPLQEVDIELFKRLKAGDILFIDSTHVARFDSDVVYEILEILPILSSGVIVHIHDIFLPDDYPAKWISEDRFFWNEQYMLQAFLSMNKDYKIEIPLHAIKQELSDMVLGLPIFEETGAPPTSLWMRRL